MGYSISVSCKSTQAAERLARFLRSAATPFSAMLRESPEHEELIAKVPGFLPMHDNSIDWDPTQHIHLGHALAYGSGNTKVGFNFSSQGIYGYWMYALTAWAALRVGRKRGLNALSTLGYAGQQVAYTTYDSDPTPVLTKADIADWTPVAQDYARWRWLVNCDGLREVEDATHYAKRIYGHHKADRWAIAFKAQDNLLRAVAERELHKLSYWWDDFMDKETR